MLSTLKSIREYDWESVSAWEVLDIFHDVWTVGSSLVDIVTDILVAYEFYQKEHYTFFYLSVSIFIAAQLSYSFLFAGTWAQGKSSFGKITVFFIVLPFAQLIPIFAWLESFRFPFIDKWLRKLSLTPTGQSQEVVATPTNAVIAIQTQDDESDSLWTYIQKKYTAHAGFLAEAFVEAIPQGVLQTVAILILDDTSPLNIFSILMSITVVASKGYLVSYSIHRPSFIFNYLTIAADSFALFATVTWLYVSLPGLSENPLVRHPWLCYPALIGMCCCAYGGFFLLLFAIFDDHLKSILPGIYEDFSDTSAWFEFYLLRLTGWTLAVLPSSVVYLTSKFSLLPIVVFGSLDPEHAVHARFYQPLFRFLDGNIAKERYLTQLPVVQNKSNNNNNENNEDDEDDDSNGNCFHKVSSWFRHLIIGNQSTRESNIGAMRVSAAEIALSSQSVNQQQQQQQQNNKNIQNNVNREPKFGALDRQVRLQVANRFLFKAKQNVLSLEKDLKKPSPATFVNGRYLTVAERAKRVYREWLEKLDSTEKTRVVENQDSSSNNQDRSSTHGQDGDQDDDMLALLRAEAARLRQENIRAMADGALDDSASHLKARSEILRHFITRDNKDDNEDADDSSKSPSGNGCGGLMKHLWIDCTLCCHPSDQRWTSPKYRVLPAPSFLCLSAASTLRIKRSLNAGLRVFLRVAGLFALMNICVAALCWIPSTLIFVVYSALFPLTQMHHCNSTNNQGSDHVLLPCMLSGSYAFCLFWLIILTPFVSRFQLMRTDLRNAKGFPEEFYSKDTSKDIYRRYVAARSRIEVSKKILKKVGRYNFMEILAYVDESNRDIAYV